MILVSKEKFMNWLKENDYKDWTGSGYPSTIHQYIYWIERVMKRENIESWSALTDHIQILCRKYGEYGSERNYGQQAHSTVINALRRFMEYLLNECDFKPDSRMYK